MLFSLPSYVRPGYGKNECFWRVCLFFSVKIGYDEIGFELVRKVCGNGQH